MVGPMTMELGSTPLGVALPSENYTHLPASPTWLTPPPPSVRAARGAAHVLDLRKRHFATTPQVTT
eukprot:CAMPEP_0119505336 /NCGR_PEP_ID=MMETSP1344-20130328/25909_1 /TAXON_ID=236787 /ORGANISM="Florenciella parvula, Strain CCMP2471" /LENGTH=65 /DNA_ID=CAMNT_0007541781 /DNA_START=14 /DNA_END=207 /DNA_ORIENTATION=-